MASPAHGQPQLRSTPQPHPRRPHTQHSYGHSFQSCGTPSTVSAWEHKPSAKTVAATYESWPGSHPATAAPGDADPSFAFGWPCAARDNRGSPLAKAARANDKSRVAMLAPVMEVLARFTPPAVRHAGNRHTDASRRGGAGEATGKGRRQKLHGAGRACSLWLFGKPAGCQSNQQFGRCLTSYHQIGAALVCPTSARRCVRVCGATILQGRLLGAGVGERGAADACTCCLRWCTAPVAMLASRLVRVLTVVAVCVALFVAAEGAGGVITAAVTRDMEKVRLPCVV